MIDRNNIFAAKPLPRREVQVPEWNGSVFVRALSTREFLKLNERIRQDTDRAFGHWIVATVTDEQDNPLFTVDDIAKFEEQPVGIIHRLVDAAQELCGTKEQAAGNS